MYLLIIFLFINSTIFHYIRNLYAAKNYNTTKDIIKYLVMIPSHEYILWTKMNTQNTILVLHYVINYFILSIIIFDMNNYIYGVILHAFHGLIYCLTQNYFYGLDKNKIELEQNIPSHKIVWVNKFRKINSCDNLKKYKKNHEYTTIETDNLEIKEMWKKKFAY